MSVIIDGSAGVTTNAGGSVNPSTNIDGINFSCRAFVNFNGTGTVAIRASGNVSSITDVGTGSYTVNFTTAMPDANYAAMSVSPLHSYVSNAAAPTTSGFSILNEAFSGTVTDYAYISAAVFR